MNLLHQHAVLEAVNAVHRARKIRTEFDADRAARHLVAGTDQVVVDGDHGVGGHGEAKALVAARLGEDGRVHADDVAIHIQQRSAGVARIDGRVGLNEVLELTGSGRIDGPVLGRDDARCNGLRQRKGTADGADPVAHLRVVGVAQLDGRQRRAGVNLDDRQVGGLIEANHVRRPAHILVVGIGGQLDVNLVGLLDHVIVGDDVALGIDDEARAQRFANLVLVPASLVRHLAAEEAIEEVLEVALALLLVVVVAIVAGLLGQLLHEAMRIATALVRGLLGEGLGVDVHHRRPNLPGDLHKLVGRHRRIDHLEWHGVGAVVLLVLCANPVSRKRTCHNGGRKRREQDEC